MPATIPNNAPQSPAWRAPVPAPNKYEKRVSSLLKEAEGIIESLGPIPPWEQAMRRLPTATADCLLSCARTLAKVDGVVIERLYKVNIISVLAYFLTNKISTPTLLSILIANNAFGLGHLAIERNDWLSLRNIVGNLVSTLKSAKREAARSTRQQPPSLETQALNVSSSRDALQALKERIETSSTRAIAPEGLFFFERIDSLLELTEDFCRNPRNRLPSPLFNEPLNNNPRRVVISDANTALASV